VADHRTAARAAGQILALALLLAALAGCTATGGAQPATTTTTQLDRVAVWRQLIQCVRENGMPNLPEPRFDENGEPQWPGGVEPPDPPRRALQACRAIADRLEAWERTDPTRPPADIPALVRFARCMREQGVAGFPDPKADGTFPISGTSIEREGKSPRMLRAMRACKPFNPDPKGGFHGS
jgi:hypothetical protein